MNANKSEKYIHSIKFNLMVPLLILMEIYIIELIYHYVFLQKIEKILHVYLKSLKIRYSNPPIYRASRGKANMHGKSEAR